MQRLAGGVQVQRGHILDQGELDLIPAGGLRQGLQPIDLAQAPGHGLFHNGLAGGNGVEGGLEGVALDGEFPVPGDEVLPGQSPGALKEGVKIPGGEGAQLQKHPLAAAQVQVQTGDVRLRAPAADPAVFRPDLLQAQMAHLVGHQALQPEQAGHGQGHHGKSLLNIHGSIKRARLRRKGQGNSAPLKFLQLGKSIADNRGKCNADCGKNHRK